MLVCVAASCSAPGGTRHVGFHVDVVASDAYDAEVETVGFAAEGETDYDTTRLGLGVRADSAAGAREHRALVYFGFARFHELDAAELGVEGRWFLSDGGWVLPFAGVGGRITAFEEVDSREVGSMLTVAPLVGLEFPLGDAFAFDLVLEYGWPLIPASSEGEPTVETSAEGLALRFGLTWDFGGQAADAAASAASEPSPQLPETP